jgi:hypothetical protein
MQSLRRFLIAEELKAFRFGNALARKGGRAAFLNYKTAHQRCFAGAYTANINFRSGYGIQTSARELRLKGLGIF